MLTKTFQEQWAAALESGKYKQGQGQLRSRDNLYCCLGVAVDVTCPERWTNEVDRTVWGLYADSGIRSYGFRTGYWTDDIAREFGLTQKEQEHLSNMNDRGDTFADIAKYIRSLPTRD